MKFKDIISPLLLIALGILFLAASAWVFISKDKRAIRYKYKIGGLLLSLSLFASSSCSSNDPVLMCYDPAPPNNSIYPLTEKNNLELEDSLLFHIYSPTHLYYSYQIKDSTENKELQKGKLEFSKEKQFYFVPMKIMPDQYDGSFFINIYGEDKEDMEQQTLLFTEKYVLNDAPED